MKTYDPTNWYWFVGGDETKAFSSASGDYVPADDPAFLAWRVDGNPTRIDTEDNLADVLASASVRPTRANILDKYKNTQASRLTMELVAKVLFNHENRLRALESKPSVTAGQFAGALKAML